MRKTEYLQLANPKIERPSSLADILHNRAAMVRLSRQFINQNMRQVIIEWKYLVF